MALMDYLKSESLSNDLTPVAVEQKPEAEVPDPVKVEPERPEWMTDEDWKAATQYYSPEQINHVYKNFDPNSVEPFYQTLYKSTRQAPSLPDEKRIRAANNIASAMDGLKLLVQGFAGYKGAYIPKDETSAQKENDAYVQRLRDIYKSDRERYDSGLYNSTLADIEAARQGYNRDRSGLLGVIHNTRQLKNQRDLANAKNVVDTQRWNAQESRLNKDAEERIRHNQEMEKVSKENAVANQIRAKTSGGSSKSDRFEEYYDPNTGATYKLKKNAFKSLYPRLFREMEKDVFNGNSSEKRKYEALSPSERMNYVLAHWMDSPAAVNMMQDMAVSVKEGEKKVDVNNQQKSKKIGW